LSVVVDASAVLAVLQGERGAEAVQPRLAGARMSAVNYAECVAKLIDRRLRPGEAILLLDSLGFDVAPLDDEAARRLAPLRARFRRAGLSFADCACLALAGATGLPALTADRRWAEIDHGIAVEVFR
jgi:PIN domain nuclease of toxin-antitoxin system